MATGLITGDGDRITRRMHGKMWDAIPQIDPEPVLLRSHGYECAVECRWLAERPDAERLLGGIQIGRTGRDKDCATTVQFDSRLTFPWHNRPVLDRAVVFRSSLVADAHSIHAEEIVMKHCLQFVVQLARRLLLCHGSTGRDQEDHDKRKGQ